MNVLISGFTGAGKTGVATALASALGWTFVSGAQVRQDAYQLHLQGTSSDFWRFSEDSAELDLKRIVAPNDDKAIDRRLAEMIAASSHCVFDVWFVPWLLGPSTSIKVWLDVPFELRVSRLASSSHRSPVQVRLAIGEKDGRAISYVGVAYDVEMRTDRTPFDIVVDAGSYSISEITSTLSSIVKFTSRVPADDSRSGATLALPSGFSISSSFAVRLRHV